MAEPPVLVQGLHCWGNAFFFFLALGLSRAIPREATLSALGGHPCQGGLGKETLALDGETRGGLGWPSRLPPSTV